MSSTRAKIIAVFLVTAVSYFTGCATSTQNSIGSTPDQQPNTFGLPRTNAASTADNADIQRLADLWLKRSQEKIDADFPVGVGDTVEISVPPIEELRSRTVRIAGDGTIALPFIGKLEAAGLTEEELQQKVVDRLKTYMYNPRVIVFVKEYHSRQVAVLGGVTKPGVYSLVSGADTLIDVLSQAGGIAAGSEAKVYLIPAEYAENEPKTQIALTMPQSILQKDSAPLILKRTDPILIDVKEVSFGGNQQYLSLPVRPGDVIMVPNGGQVLIEGWVEKPGAYGLSPGLTLAGLVAQAGGPLYPAEVNSVKVIRAERGGSKSFAYADLEKIKRGESQDISLQGGDIVDVSPQTSKLVGYGLYRFFTAIVNIGVGTTFPK